VVADGSGSVVKRIDYDSFGNILADTNPTLDVPFGFAGGLHDRDTGLVRFGFRDYDPNTGRSTATDPIGFAGGNIDLYGYCLNDPINLVDPIGLYSFREGLRDTQKYAFVFATGSVFLPGGQTGTIVFGTIGFVATALEIGLYSDDPFWEGMRESVKMLISIKNPFIDKATDEVINELYDRFKDMDYVQSNKACPEPDIWTGLTF
jgi:RHS repeat-associated protein